MPAPDRTAGVIVIGTRGSPLALAQTNLVRDALLARHPDLAVEILRITTTGDVLHDVPLAAFAGQGVFVSEIERALADGRVDLAVHSAKDLPSRLPAGLTIAAIPERADARDVLVSRAGRLSELPAGARVGTSSPRRVCQIRASRPDVAPTDVRGNVDTRLRKLESGAYDALVLAAAGLIRLGVIEAATEWLDTDVMLPAVGQGALALEVREDDERTAALVAPLSHGPTSSAVQAERAFLARLGAGCAAAVAAYATVGEAGVLTLRALIGTIDGSSVRGTRQGAAAAAEGIGRALADELLDAGGQDMLALAGERAGVQP